jgi:hypothetical protein
VRDGAAGPQPDPLGGVVVGPSAEGLLGAPVDRIEVDADGGEQLGVGGLGTREHAPGDQPADLGADGLQVQAVGAQHGGRRVVAVHQQAEQQVLRADVVSMERPAPFCR